MSSLSQNGFVFVGHGPEGSSSSPETACWTSGSWQEFFFRCILASIALLQPDLGHLEASPEPGRFNRVVVYSPTWECIQCIQCHCIRCSDISYRGATATVRKVRCSYETENAKQMHGQQCKLVSIKQ